MSKPACWIFGLLALALPGCAKPPAASDAAAHSPASASSAATEPGAPEPSSAMVFLLIGQSNMAGAPKPVAEDQVEDPRVRVLAYQDCPNLGRQYNQWYTARPPLHDCYGGVGPGDYFGKALAKAYPEATIDLVPLAISGVDIDFFVKGVVSKRRGEFSIPPDNHWSGAYEWVLERARLAQRVGTIRGIIFHQGESDTGNAPWIDKVKQLVSDLRVDLQLGEVPFVAGELLESGCCGKWHNPLVQQLPQAIANTRVVSAAGLAGMDSAHFDLAGQRELGARYGAAMLELLKQN
jgi:carbohydrate esterase-like sialic acid-specific acetylesterase